MRSLPLTLLLVAASAPLDAQQSLVSRTLDSATVVRLHLVRGDVVHGVLLEPLGPVATAITFAPPTNRDCGVPRAICRMELPVMDVRAVEIQRGSHAGRGAFFGAFVGAVTGFVLGWELAQNDLCPTDVPCSPPSDGAIISITTLLGGALGAGIGALFGLGSTAWRPAP